MPWNSTWPVGNISVKGNKTPGQQNTTYIEFTMGKQAVGSQPPAISRVNDHFWNVGSNEDGRHRFIQSPGFTSTTGVAPNNKNPVLGTGMNGAYYLRLVNSSVGRHEWFARNAQGIFQATPCYITGTVSVPGSGTAIVSAVPENVYGEIFVFKTPETGSLTFAVGYFKSTTAVNCNVVKMAAVSGSSDLVPVRFSGSGLNILIAKGDGTAGTWEYRITYRAHNADG